MYRRSVVTMLPPPRPHIFRQSGFVTLFCLVVLSAQAQQSPSGQKNVSPSQPPSAANPAKPDTRPSEPPPVLRQFNAALEGLVAKASPAVVQVLVTGYGTANESSHTETALIVR